MTPTLADGTRDGSSQGALLTMKRHQKAPATRKEAPLDACVVFGRKTWQSGHRLQHQRQRPCAPPICPQPCPQTYHTFAKDRAVLQLATAPVVWHRAPRAAVNTARATPLAEELPRARRQRRARASHIARGHRASETTHKRRPPTRVTQTSPRALQPTHTPKRAGPLPHEAGQPRPS